MPYLLDANVFITASNLHYGMDFCPAFWDWIEREYGKGKVFSIDKIEDELKVADDNVSKWIDNISSGFFLPTNNSISHSLTKVSKWVMDSKKYEPTAIRTFLQKADYYLIAHALSLKCKVVTHEVPSHSIKKIKIPDVCMGLGVKWVTPYMMLKKDRARFVLAP